MGARDRLTRHWLSGCLPSPSSSPLLPLSFLFSSLLLILDFSKFSVPHFLTLLPFSFITTSLTSLPHFLPIPPSIFPLHLFLSFPFFSFLSSPFLPPPPFIFPSLHLSFLSSLLFLFHLSLPCTLTFPFLFHFLSFPFYLLFCSLSTFPFLSSYLTPPPSLPPPGCFFFFRSEFACRFRVFSSMSRPCYQT